MEAILVMAFLGMVMGFARYLTSGRRKAQARAWRQAADRVGLTAVSEKSGGLLGEPLLTGRSGPLPVTMFGYRQGKAERGTTIVVGGLGHGRGALSARREGLMERTFGSGIELGAPEFDAQVYLRGDRDLALAVFDARTRRRLAALLQGLDPEDGRKPLAVEAQLVDGHLTVRVRGPADGERLAGILEAVLDVARRLVAPQDLARRIADNLRREPAEGVRLQALELLAGEYPDHAATREALLAACRDRSDEVRFRAARRLGEDGRETLLGLVASPGTNDACAARAAAALGGRLPAGQAAATLRHALKWQRHATARACLDALGRHGDSGSESLLRQGLESESPEVAVAAARALGRAGTAAAVPALRATAETARGDLRGAARQAIAAIQTRLAGAAAGQLSLAGGEAGALSFAEGEPGRLSFSGAAAGELGLTDNETDRRGLANGEPAPPEAGEDLGGFRPQAGRESAG